MGSIVLNFKDTLLFSRLHMELNFCLKVANDALASNDFISCNKKRYSNRSKKLGYKSEELPFENEDCEILFQILFSRIWDVFILYLKQVLLIAESSNKEFSKNKAQKIDNYRYQMIKTELDKLNLCNKDNEGWETIEKIKDARDKYTHQSHLSNIVKSMLFQSKKYIINKPYKISHKDIFIATNHLHKFARQVDQNLIKNHDAFSFFFRK